MSDFRNQLLAEVERIQAQARIKAGMKTPSVSKAPSSILINPQQISRESELFQARLIVEEAEKQKFTVEEKYKNLQIQLDNVSQDLATTREELIQVRKIAKEAIREAPGRYKCRITDSNAGVVSYTLDTSKGDTLNNIRVIIPQLEKEIRQFYREITCEDIRREFDKRIHGAGESNPNFKHLYPMPVNTDIYTMYKKRVTAILANHQTSVPPHLHVEMHQQYNAYFELMEVKYNTAIHTFIQALSDIEYFKFLIEIDEEQLQELEASFSEIVEQMVITREKWINAKTSLFEMERRKDEPIKEFVDSDDEDTEGK